MKTVTNFQYSSTFANQGWYFVLITYLISWVLWLPVVLSGLDVISTPIESLMPLVLLGTFVPSITGFVLTKYQPSNWSTKQLAKRIVQGRFSWKLYMFLLLMFPILTLSAHGLNVLINQGSIPGIEVLKTPWVIYATLLVMILIGGPLGEEFGWRGYLQDRLDHRFGTLGGSVLVGLFWGFWHIPFFLVPASPQFHMPFWLFLLTDVSVSVIIGYCQKLAKGSLIPAFLLHGWINTSMELFPLLKIETGENWQPWLFANIFLVFIGVTFVILSQRTSETISDIKPNQDI